MQQSTHEFPSPPRSSPLDFQRCQPQSGAPGLTVCSISAGCAIDLTALGIVSGKRCWVLLVDGLVVAADGNLLDALSIATKVRYPPHPRLSFGSLLN